jgi:LmbE family N-acetylglucosaminyl deacetylase
MAQNQFKLMCVLAHPDDESLGTGGTLAKYGREGVDTFLVTATRGQRGRFGNSKESPGIDEVGEIRERELLCAAGELGVKEVNFLNYVDGELDKVNSGEVIAAIVSHIRRIKPQIIITFGPEGGYGHPDHIAICQSTTSATLCAADPNYHPKEYNQPEGEAHRVHKLYYMAWPPQKWQAYQAALRDLKINVDGIERRATPFPDWAVTTIINTEAYWPVTWRAVCCHKTQMSIYNKLENLPEERHKAIWGTQEYYRVFSTVNGGRQLETDLFKGLR